MPGHAIKGFEAASPGEFAGRRSMGPGSADTCGPCYATSLIEVDEINIEQVDDTHFFTLSQVYEDLLVRMGEKNADGGQFFTPRELIRAMVHTVDPEAGKTTPAHCPALHPGNASAPPGGRVPAPACRSFSNLPARSRMETRPAGRTGPAAGRTPARARRRATCRLAGNRPWRTGNRRRHSPRSRAARQR